jgi:hypothetical protein
MGEAVKELESFCHSLMMPSLPSGGLLGEGVLVQATFSLEPWAPRGGETLPDWVTSTEQL